MTYTARITSKGQVTIPKTLREKLRTDLIEFEDVQDHIEIRPVRLVGAELSAYASPEKRRRESIAWEKLAVKKHEDR